jgi:hypothetical protein
VARSNSAFGAFFRRKRTQLGPQQAIVATAHKIARTVYAMLKNRSPYQDLGAETYEVKYRQQEINYLKRKAAKLGFNLLPQEDPALLPTAA